MDGDKPAKNVVPVAFDSFDDTVIVLDQDDIYKVCNLLTTLP